MRGSGDKGSLKWLALSMSALAVWVTLLLNVESGKGGTRNVMIRLKKREMARIREYGGAGFQAPPHQREEANRTTTVAATIATRTEHRGKAPSTQGSPLVQPRQPPKKSRLPNFLLAGVQKAGTSAISNYLRQQKNQVCFGLDPKSNESLKEVHFFDARGTALLAENYRTYFRHCAQQQPIVMDATPNYIAWPDQIHRMYRQDGTAETLKILLVLREPVSRALSYYHHMVYKNLMAAKGSDGEWFRKIRVKKRRNKRNDNTDAPQLMDFQEFAQVYEVPETVRGGRRSYGRYALWIEEWLRWFDRGQIWIASYDELKNEPSRFLVKLHSFLNLTEPEKPALPKSCNAKRLPARLVKSRPSVPSCEVQESLAQLFAPYNQQLYQFLANRSQGAPSVETQPFPPFRFSCKEAW